nr:hypothetical protein [Caballeronia udeis]
MYLGIRTLASSAPADGQTFAEQTGSAFRRAAATRCPWACNCPRTADLHHG